MEERNKEEKKKQYKTMNKYIPHDMAIKLYALGFNQPCTAYYSCNAFFNTAEKPKLIKSESFDAMLAIGYDCPAPTYQQVFDWLRTEYNTLTDIHINFIEIRSIPLDIGHYWLLGKRPVCAYKKALKHVIRQIAKQYSNGTSKINNDSVQ